MGWLAAVAGAVAPGILPSVAGYFSARDAAKAQRDANERNVQLAGDQMHFSAGQAAEQMAFQERMSSTSHQREVEDLRAAGLNPLLSALGGASTPGGAMGSSASASVDPVPSRLQGLVGSALEGLRFSNESKIAKANIKKISSEADFESMRAKWARRNPDAAFGGQVGALDNFVSKLALRSKYAVNKAGTGIWEILTNSDDDYISDSEMRRRGNNNLNERRLRR